MNVYMYSTSQKNGTVLETFFLTCTVPFTTTSVITQYGQTALMIAASVGHTEVVVELVKAKANLDLQNKVCT